MAWRFLYSSEVALCKILKFIEVLTCNYLIFPELRIGDQFLHAQLFSNLVLVLLQHVVTHK